MQLFYNNKKETMNLNSPARQENETFEDYKKRRAELNFKSKKLTNPGHKTNPRQASPFFAITNPLLAKLFARV